MPPFEIAPGDVLLTRSPGFWPKLIREGEALAGLPNVSNHVAVVHHTDPQGRWWVIEGRPGGVGYRLAADYLANPYTLNNVLQPGRTEGQRAYVAHRAELMLGTKYDWEAIADDGLRAFNMPALFEANTPVEVVCSSFAAWLYRLAGWGHPMQDHERGCEPADWDEFVLTRHYNAQLVAPHP